MSVRKFIFSRYFLKQLVIAVSLSVVLIWAALKMLDLYTMRGQLILVPDLEYYPAEEAAAILADMNLRHVINDSIFDSTREPGSVALQDPLPGSGVKRNRTVYLTTVALLPEMVPMPDLVDLSSRQAIAVLETHGLKVGRIEFRPDIARNAVLEQLFNDGHIEAGAPVAKGTAIDLVLGEGLGENITIVPFVFGMTPAEAARTLVSASLNVGEESFSGDITTNPRVYKQTPHPLDGHVYLQAGSTVNLTYRSDDAFDFESYLVELLSVPLPYLIGKTPDEVRIILEKQDLIVGRESFLHGASRDNAVVVRQDPPFEEDAIIQKGEAINVWYEPEEEIEAEDPNDFIE